MASESGVLAARRLRYAHEALTSARLNVTHGLPISAINRAYYAAFYAAKAALGCEGIEVGKHTAVQGELHRVLVHTGRLDPTWGRAFLRLFEARSQGDYSMRTEPGIEEAAVLVALAGDFVAEMHRMLSIPPLDPE
jgi:uncharacterized protein (UPF0332 family)